MFRDVNNIPEWGREVRKIEWKRPEKLAPNAKFIMDKEGELKQGGFTESWFNGAVIIIAS